MIFPRILKASDALYNWHVLEPLINEAIEKTDTDEEPLDYQQLVKEEKISVILWEHGTKWAVMLAGVDTHNGENWLHVYVLSGPLPEGWVPVMDAYLTEVAKDHHMDYVTLRGRKGWIRKLKDYGYRLEDRGNIIKEVKR